MEHAQTIRVYAPAWRVRSLKVDSRPLSAAEGGPSTDPLFHGHAERIAGSDFEPDSTMVEALATCQPTVEAIKQFTQRFGPVSGPATNGSFTFSLAEFVSVQRLFQYTWDRALGVPALVEPYRSLERALGESQQSWRQVAVSGIIEFRSTGLVHCAETLYAALVFKLFSLAQRKKLRRCSNPGCTDRRYFVAGHPKDRYCSDICAQWAQAQAKRRWWGQTGDEWRKKRATSRSHTPGSKTSTRKGE